MICIIIWQREFRGKLFAIGYWDLAFGILNSAFLSVTLYKSEHSRTALINLKIDKNEKF